MGRRKYVIVKTIDDLEGEQDNYVVKDAAESFNTSAMEAKFAALVLIRRSCPSIAVDIVARCLITAYAPDFFAAVLQGDICTTKRMLAWDGTLLGARDEDGELDFGGATALTHAVASGSAELVALLVSAGADTFAVGHLGN